MSRKTKKSLLNNTGLYLLLGIILAILVARAYVYMGGDLSISYYGIIFHHIFLGIILVLVSGFAFFSLNSMLSKNRLAMNLSAFLFGFGAGLITDEANFLVSVGEYYNLSNYYQPLNLYINAIFIAVVAFFIAYSFIRKD
jgi:hypothetical protein